MAIRLPLVASLSYSNQTIQGGGPASVNGGVAKQFFIPQDTDNVVVKLQASVLGGGVSATFQTTDDGGLTWFDVARTSIVSYTGNSVAGGSNTNAEWMSIPVMGLGQSGAVGLNTSVISVGSVVTFNQTIGAAAASSLGVKTYSGLPILSTNARIFLRYTAAITSIINESVTVYTNSQTPQP